MPTQNKSTDKNAIITTITTISTTAMTATSAINVALPMMEKKI